LGKIAALQRYLTTQNVGFMLKKRPKTRFPAEMFSEFKKNANFTPKNQRVTNSSSNTKTILMVERFRTTASQQQPEKRHSQTMQNMGMGHD